ncbi:MAG TPA: NAD(P)-binding domain-containing protein [Longimicrobiales bacterium]|nr:NAD(P)-binding domain-containing protein [Longimicrobiales bacterium]
MSEPVAGTGDAGPVGIVGAGPAGLTAAVALQARGIPFEIVDAGDGVGGIWDIDRAETPMYEAAHFISSRTMSGFPGFPMPDDYPDYPRHDQVLRYIRAYADRHGLTGRVRLRTTVERAEPRADGAGWDVRVATGETRRWGALMVATGTTWQPHLPDVAGTFEGEQIHSFAFRSAEVFRGKRVLVVGCGNSGADIACEAASAADKAFISLRRGYHFVPKYFMGKPADVFAHGGPRLPWRLEEIVFGFLLDKVLVGDLANYGLPRPDHPILRSHPIMNTRILHHLGHGDLEYRPDVKELRGRSVVFVDGREEDVDLIVWATGYERRFPFLDEEGGEGKLDLYLELFHRVHPTLFFMGLFETDGAAYEMFGLQAEAVAAYLAARRNAPEVAERFDALRANARPDLHGGRPYLDTLRHAYYVRGDVYTRALKDAGRRLESAPRVRRGA